MGYSVGGVGGGLRTHFHHKKVNKTPPHFHLGGDIHGKGKKGVAGSQKAHSVNDHANHLPRPYGL